MTTDRRPLTLDPALFAPDAIAPETARFNEELEKLAQSMPSVVEAGVEATRAARNEGQGSFNRQPPSPTARTRSVEAAGAPATVRIFRPATGAPTGAYLHMHGGGWCLGGADMQDTTLQTLADGVGCAVVSVEYRLAPEHRHPAGADDCFAAASWLLDEGRAELGVERLVIGGESAGAHLCALTLARLRRSRGATGFAAANLVYGCFDLSMTPSMRNWGERRLVLSTPIVEWLVDGYLPLGTPRGLARQAPDISPLYADLTGLPPALFTVGTLDPLLDDTLMMACRWSSTGQSAELKVYPGGVHGFDLFDQPLGRRALADQAAFIHRALRDPDDVGDHV